MGRVASITIIIIIIASAVVVPIAVIGADIALSISSFDTVDVNIDVGDPRFEFSEDYRTIYFSVDIAITTPSLGFIPKSIAVRIQLYDDDDNPIRLFRPIIIVSPLSATKTVSLVGILPLSDDAAQFFLSGGSITLTIKSTAGLNCLGLEIENLDLPAQTIVIP